MGASKTYVRVQDGLVYETVSPFINDAGDYVPIEERFAPDYVNSLVDITDVSPQPEPWWTYSEGVFSPPKPYVPTAEEVLAENVFMKGSLLGVAALAIAPLQDAVDLEEATSEETTLLKAWKQYRVAINRIDLTLPSPSWPPQP
nr:tail fiber assembly protein [uncultured Pseudomonas sp.]